MKRTDQERIERELKRREKHAKTPERKTGDASGEAGAAAPRPRPVD